MASSEVDYDRPPEAKDEKSYMPNLQSADIKKELQLRIKKNQIRMLKERGYKLTSKDEEFLNMDLSDFKTYFSKFKAEHQFWDSLSQIYTLKSTGKYKENYDIRIKYGFGEKVFVVFPMYTLDTKKNIIKKEPISTIDTIIKQVNNINIKKEYADEEIIRSVIIISVAGLAGPALKATEKRRGVLWIQNFNYIEMSYVPIDHKLSSQYRLLSEDEWEQIREKDSISKKIIPKIYLTDMIVRYYGVFPGSVFEVTNKNYIPEAMFSQRYGSVEYRVVI